MLQDLNWEEGFRECLFRQHEEGHPLILTLELCKSYRGLLPGERDAASTANQYKERIDGVSNQLDFHHLSGIFSRQQPDGESKPLSTHDVNDPLEEGSDHRAALELLDQNMPRKRGCVVGGLEVCPVVIN